METPELKKAESNAEEKQNAAEIAAKPSEIEQIAKPVEYPQIHQSEQMPAPEISPAEIQKDDADELLLPSQDIETEEDDKTEFDENATSQSDLHTSDLTKEELVEKLQNHINQGIDIAKAELDSIKHSFYQRINTENKVLREKFIDAGGAPEDFKPQKDELDDTFKNLLAEIKQKRIERAVQAEKQKEQNLLEKQHIIEQMRMLVEKNDDVDKAVKEFRELQQKWKTIGAVPITQVNALWREYSQCQEAFWDLVKINNELREYDFRKNLEAKNALIDAAEKLAGEKEIVSSFKKLQKLHDEWREIGPVARDMRNEIWERFKAASAIVNKRHVEYFEKLRKNEEENTAAKQELIEKITNFDTSNLKTFKQWEDASNQILELQKQWRASGFAPRKLNQKLFEKYRKASDAFFNAKSAFFKTVRSEFSANIEKKVSLCKRAEELKDSTNWHEATARFVELQKEWKTVGSVPRKLSDTLWNRFSAACDYFFEQKKAVVPSQYSEEKENLIKKRDIVERIKSLDIANQTAALKTLKELIVEWNSVGFVPFKEKENLHHEYRAAITTQFDALNVDDNARRLDSFRSNIATMAARGNDMHSEHKKLMRAYERMKQELNTYENNLGFFTSSSKKGGGLIEQMNKKIENLRNECKLLEEKIKLLNKEIR
ncbi:MAG: DUF349 domain-containing protein [Paludibacter sp.]|nr:DUF349 domain-containing protein [Paludibacter sp.]